MAAERVPLSPQSSQIIDILVGIDALTIDAKYEHQTKDPDNPTPVDAEYIYMITRQDAALSGEGGGNLKITANPLDTIRWRETALSMSSDYSVLLYRYVSKDTKLVSPAEANIANVLSFLPKEDSGGSPDYDTQNIDVSYWTSQVRKPGEAVYTFYFQIFKGKDRIGFYSWDPRIHIAQP